MDEIMIEYIEYLMKWLRPEKSIEMPWNTKKLAEIADRYFEGKGKEVK